MNQPFDKKRYRKVVQECQLVKDFSTFKHGDQTKILKSGSNLSGGQKQRVNLARCIYSKADIYLLDSPTSAIDEISRKNIFDNVFSSDKGILAKKVFLHFQNNSPFIFLLKLINW